LGARDGLVDGAPGEAVTWEARLEFFYKEKLLGPDQGQL